MKFSENWLRELVNTTIQTEELVKLLTMAGLEVDSVEPVAALFDKIVIGEVLGVEPHPNAKKLSICQVNVGEEEPLLNIVCGASNVHIGMRVPTALIGAHVGKMHIKQAKLRGISSHGMLCSAKELGLAETSDGIMPLPKDAPIGRDLRHYLRLDDVSIELELTPNRGDCLSINGIAREVGVLTRCPVHLPTYPPVAATISDSFPVEILNSNACPRYVGRIIKKINAKAPTPIWMQERLRRSGLRSISAIVDITNYVLVELGQPMHAFDFANLNGGIQVRMVQAGESLTLLNEQTVNLDEQTLIIADYEQPLAMAGVMGGQSSAVTMQTVDIFLESAFFTPQHIAGCARRYGLHTDSSHRFERGVDPKLQANAIERATALLLDIVGGQAGQVIEVASETMLPIVQTIELRATRIQRLLGQAIDTNEISDILARLGMTVIPMQFKNKESLWQVRPPSFRFDIAFEADLIEEIARVHGYNNLPSHALQSRLTMHPQPLVRLEQVQAVLVQRDYQEVITYSFVDPKLQTKLNPEIESITLANPIASDMAVMRTTLWASLLPILVYNQKRQQSRVRIFETGLRFIQSKQHGLQQEKMLAGIVSGTRWPEQWGQAEEPVDFFDVKADIEALLNLTVTNPSQSDVWHFASSTHSALHPGQTAAIYRGDSFVGLLGAIHPNLGQILELTLPVYLFELRLAPLYQTDIPKYKSFSKHPSVRRDIAIVVPEEVRAAELLNCVKLAATEILFDWQLFDIYQGESIEIGKKSLAIGLIFQSDSHNLTDLEVETVVEQILRMLEQNLGAQLRK